MSNEQQYGDKIIKDYATCLTWQQGSSPENIKHQETQTYLDKLNDKKFAGYNDWRLPTLEEAMSLIEPLKNKNGQHIDAIFDTTRLYYILTSDKYDPAHVLGVSLLDGFCYCYAINEDHIGIRAVHSGC